MSKSDFGLYGLAVMGQNLVLNVESRGFQVSVYNRTTSVTDDFIAAHPGKKLVGAHTVEDFVQSLARPRKIHIMVKSTAVKDTDRDAVDAVIEQLIPLLDEDDIIIDGGNSFYQATERRDAYLATKGLRFIGAGVSGGEEGARKGPSIMPGGPASTWEVMKPIFESIAAKVDGEPCVIHIGPGGAGHYVKMIHNGIEYGDMQLICEAYNIFKHAGFTTDEMAAIFNEWNDGELQSYLIQITGKALEQIDPETGHSVVELIVDKAGQKGTGQWTLLNAAENAVVISTINAAVEARILSSKKKERVLASKELRGPAPTGALTMGDGITPWPKEILVQKVHDALYASKIISYAQGLDLIKTMSGKKNWDLDLGRIAAIWRGGCIIRARFLNFITDAYRSNPGLGNLMLDPYFKNILNGNQQSWREVVSLAMLNGIPVPAFSASLGYYDSYRAERLPANLLQAQRDFFGAHTYERVDKPEGEFFHTDWPEVIG
ncbi:MAG: decarboxylating NADP(+)-dependent phosphogluconate dehydrogenase [Verrucomicrobiales bacterium]|nr:decarboxylating NADP(+)-dependent phosphogluconate dehydrogenase [Verrucomicrobiales bacterium]